MKPTLAEIIASFTLLGTISIGIVVELLLGHGQSARMLALVGGGVALHILANGLIRWKQSKVPLVAMALVLVPNARGQSIEPLPAYAMSYQMSIGLTQDADGPQPIGIIPAAICIGIGVGIIGYVGVKIISACLKIHENGVTNNQNKATLSSPVPDPSGPPGTCACAASPPAGQPLPVVVEHSYDDQHWSTVAHGPLTGQWLDLPDKGYWRIRPLPLRIEVLDGGVVLSVPPGVLEASRDLENWTVLVSSAIDFHWRAEPSTFYRVRMN